MATTSPVVAIPEVGGNESLDELVRKLLGWVGSFGSARYLHHTHTRHWLPRFFDVVLWRFFVQAIETPHAWEELRREEYPRSLRPLVRYLVDEVQHEAIVSALLW